MDPPGDVGEVRGSHVHLLLVLSPVDPLPEPDVHGVPALRTHELVEHEPEVLEPPVQVKRRELLDPAPDPLPVL